MTKTDRKTWQTLLAFAIIYFVWGSTFLAIRIGVHEVPPLLLAAMRFGTAGAVLVGWLLARRKSFPKGREWLSIFLIAFLIFVVDYGLLFWAEQRIPSGVAAVILATIPVFMAIAEILILRTQKFTLRLSIALLIGMGGVALLMFQGNSGLGALVARSGAPVEETGALALIIASASWALASILTRKLPLPESKVMSSGTQMLAGGAMLAVASAACGELRGFHPMDVSRGAWLALVYLIVAGSIIGFTAYVWLIHRESPTRVGTYAYVNPVVAVVLGHFLGAEPLGLRTVLGTLLILCSVLLITIRASKQPPGLAAGKGA